MPEASHIPQIVGGVIALLMIAAAILALTRRLKFPFTVALVLIAAGLSLSVKLFPHFVPSLRDLEISPALILYVFLPVLIFESAFNLNARLMRQNHRALEKENERRKNENADSLELPRTVGRAREDGTVTSGLPELEMFSKK